MDPVSALTASIDLFTTCLHAYRTVATAIEVGSDAVIWDVMMRIERTRFEIWGRTLGFLDDQTGAEKLKDAEGQYPVAGLSDILYIEVARDIVRDIFKSIESTLKEFNDVAKRYHLHPQSGAPVATDGTPAANDGHDAGSGGERRSERKRERLRKFLSTSGDFARHLLLVVKDENMVEDLLKRLSTLNDGLDKLYSASQRTQAARALPAGVLSEYDKASELSVVLSSTRTSAVANIQGDQSTNQSAVVLGGSHSDQAILAATARVKQMCIDTATETTRVAASPGAAMEEQKKRVLGEVASSQISIDKVRVHQVPQTTKLEHFWPLGSAKYTANTSSSPVKVLVEWRMPYPVLPSFHVAEDELSRRRDLVAQLLHQISNMASASGYRVLDCLGHINYTGRVDGEPTEVIGFMSRLPDWADADAEPVTLQKLLSDSFNAESPGTIPSLRTRLGIARSVSTALYQLQCSQWLHRSLTSQNIVFFVHKDTGAANLEEPFLIGLQYSRPDDQPDPSSPYQGSQVDKPFSEFLKIASWGSLALYLHPDHSRRRRRYRRSDDVYSLGVILFELAFWEPVVAFVEGRQDLKTEEVAEASKRILRSAEVELAAEIGETYRDATVKCLTGLRHASRGTGDEPSTSADGRSSYNGSYNGEDPEIGLENDLLWKVIREIEKCYV